MQYPPFKLPFEELTTIDERVDFIHNQLIASQLALNQLLEKEGLPTMAEITRQKTLRVTVAELKGVRVADYSPLTGTITQIAPHWPAGCNALVDVAFGHRDTWTMPSDVDTYLALDDSTPVFQYNEPISKGEEIWMIVRNGDSKNPHTISIVVTFRGTE